MRRIRQLGTERLTLLLAFGGFAWGLDCARRKIPPPNILLVSVDTLRADHLGCHGYPRATTPHIDAVARGGVRFSNAFSTSSWTMPAMMSAVTGLWPERHGAVDYQKALASGVATLASCLKEAGWVTGAIVANPSLDRRFGFGRGFDLYDDRSAYIGLDDDGAPPAKEDDIIGLVTSPMLATMATAWVRRHAGERFFLWIHFQDPHYDYAPPPPYDTVFDPDYKGTFDGTRIKRSRRLVPGLARKDLEHVIALYDGEIAFTDEHIGRLLAVLSELRIEERTLVVVVGDHGEEFLEHGKTAHGHSLYDELVRVPLVFRWPEGIRGGAESGALASLVDVMPTVLELASLSVPEGLDGVSLAPVLLGEDERGGREWVRLHVSMEADLRAVRGRGWKLVADMKKKTVECFDLRNDPLEKRRADAARAPAALAEALARSASGRPAPFTPDPWLKRQLRALGYVQ